MVEENGGGIVLESMVKEFIEAQDKRKELEKSLEFLKKIEDEKEMKLIESMENSNITSFKSPEIGTVSSARRLWGKVTDQEKAKEFFEEAGIADAMFVEQVKKDRLNEWIRGQIEKNENLPPCIDFSVTRFISIRRSK